MKPARRHHAWLVTVFGVALLLSQRGFQAQGQTTTYGRRLVTPTTPASGILTIAFPPRP